MLLLFQPESPVQLLSQCQLFAGFPKETMVRLLPDIKPEFSSYPRGKVLMACGEQSRLGIVTEGVILSSRDLGSDSSHIIEFLEEGSLFGLDAVFSHIGTCPTNLIAGTSSSVLFSI